MTLYATGTSVSVDRSKAEIEWVLKRYGAEAFGYASEPGRATIAFRKEGRSFRFDLPLPGTKEFRISPKGRSRSQAAMVEAWRGEERRRWRSLALWIKATLEAIASGLISFDQAFLGQLLLPGGRTVNEWAAPQIEAAAKDGRLPRTLLLPEAVEAR
jgi:hypothetical protein